ncbi:hypothetical protein [Scytonema sp. PRP1]|uniref:hypothetical protein n=1 Tax=Scytonema sp. PRP1 TaxID=3120513 RepID=UPI00300D569E
MFAQSIPNPCGDRYRDYHQALHNFKVAELIDAIRHLSTLDSEEESICLNEAELESLAALLIQQLALNLHSQTIAQYLWILRDDIKAIADLPIFELKPLQPFKDLPKQFPKQTPVPRFADGATVRWILLRESSKAQDGIILGHFYAYARHIRQWTWKYLVWLGQPVGQVVADTAWEDDLEAWKGGTEL